MAWQTWRSYRNSCWPQGVPEWWFMLQEWCWYLRFAEVVGSNFWTYIPHNFWQDMLFTFHERPLQFPNIFMLHANFLGAGRCSWTCIWFTGDVALSVVIKQEQFQLLEEISMQWSAIRFLETMMICLELAGLVPEMIEAGCLYGGCWNMVCLFKVVWIEIFDMTTVGLANVPWMECGSRWIIFWVLCNFSWSRSNMTLPCRLVLIIGVSIVQWRSPFVKIGFENSLVSSVGAPFWMNLGTPQITNNTFVKWLRPQHLRLQVEHILLRAGVKHGTSKRQRIAFFSIRTFATFACCTQANSGTTFAEKFEFADPTNSSARIETVEIKSIKCFFGQPKPVEGSPWLFAAAFWTTQRDLSTPRWFCIYVGGIVCGPLSTTAKTHALDRTWVGFIGTTFCSAAAEDWEMWRRTWVDSWIA